MGNRMFKKLAPVLCLACLSAAACAPAPLYTSTGKHKGAATLGEIPRDSLGEPVWSAIRRVPGAALPGEPAVTQEGDAEESPRPPRA